ncbi:MAG: sodium:solute symporter family transporter [Elusimicrobiota bacterium]
MTAHLHLGPIDWLILFAYFLALAVIGWKAAKKTAKTADDYFLAGRSIPWLVATASFFATCISALTFVGTPAEGYASDYRYLLSNPGDIAAAFFVAAVFLPRFQKLKVTSIYEVIERRFGAVARRTASAYFLITRIMASTVRVVVIAKVLEVASGGALTYGACVFLVIAAILAYATLGGGRAVAWTDTLQFILLMTGAVSAAIYIVAHVPGGVSGIIAAGRHAVRPNGTLYDKFNFLELYKPTNIGLLVLMIVWGFFNSSATYGTDQDMVQRLLACNDEKRARLSLILWGLAGIPITFLFLSIGVGLYAYAQSHPAFALGMKDPDHVFPRFILQALPQGLKGLLLAALASAAMGSADSALASLSTAFVIDFYKPWRGQAASQRECVRASKLAFVAFGAIFLLLALSLHGLDRVLWLAFRLISYTYGPLLGLFAVALMTDWTISSKDAAWLMILPTILLVAIETAAWRLSGGGSVGFWGEIHATYWRLYVVFGALFVPAGAWILKSRAPARPRTGFGPEEPSY